MHHQVVYVNLKYKPKAVGEWLLDKQKPESTKPVQVSPAGQRAEPKGWRGPEKLPDVNSYLQLRRKPFPLPRISGSSFYREIHRSQAVLA